MLYIYIYNITHLNPVFFLVSLAKVLSIVFIFPKNQLLVLLIFYIAFILFHFSAI